MDKRKSLKLVTLRQVVIMTVAAIGGIGLNAYRTYKTEGRLDSTWVWATLITLVFIGTMFIFLARYANKPEKEN